MNDFKRTAEQIGQLVEEKNAAYGSSFANTDRDALGESPWRDIAGYGICGATHIEQKRKEAACESVSAPDVANRSKGATASAETNAAVSLRQKSSRKNATKSTAVKNAANTAVSNSRKKR